MTIANAANGTQAATISTEHTLATETAVGVYVLTVDLSNMASGDTMTLRAKVKTLTGSTSTKESSITFTGAQDPAVFQSKPIAVEHEVVFTLQQTAGTGRSFPWSLAVVT